MGWWQRLFAHETGGRVPKAPAPFMEHPTGEFDSAVIAMEDAIGRLRQLSKWDQWITFSAQGQGDTPEDYGFAEVRMLRDELDVGDRPLDVSLIVTEAGIDRSSLVADGVHYSIAGASAGEVSRVLDAIFRRHFGIRPFEDEDDDYAVGAEW